MPDITNLATNTTHNCKTNQVKGKIPSITNFATTDAFNIKRNQVKTTIPSITNLTSTTVLTAVEIEIPNASTLV